MTADGLAAGVAAPCPAPGAARPGDPQLPAEAYATALAGLPLMGPSRLGAVIASAGPEAAWRHLLAGRPWSDARVRRSLVGSPADLLDTWRKAAERTDVSARWAAVAEVGAQVLLLGDPRYPPPLVGDVEPPAVVFALGSLAALDGPSVAVVGTRRCSPTGSGLALELGRDLAAAGVGVVSGLASGIDAAAHRGALAAGAAPPIGVVGSGLDVVYPRSSGGLWRSVADRGVLLSEAPPGARPERWRFPARNRIIAALADVVVVVESHHRGGSLHTVDEADRRGIDVMAAPGSVRNPAAVGTNELLAEGRAPVCSVDDVLMAIGMAAGNRRGEPVDRRVRPDAADAPVLEAVGWQPATLDQLVLRTGLDLARLAPALDRLWSAGWVTAHGGWYERVAATGCRG